MPPFPIVQIPKLPTGISYFVRIKVLGEKGEVLVETPEIQARNEIVSIKCDPDEITAPSDVDVKERAQFSVALVGLISELAKVDRPNPGLASTRVRVHRRVPNRTARPGCPTVRRAPPDGGATLGQHHGTALGHGVHGEDPGGGPGTHCRAVERGAGNGDDEG